MKHKIGLHFVDKMQSFLIQTDVTYDKGCGLKGYNQHTEHLSLLNSTKHRKECRHHSLQHVYILCAMHT
jgi:hypothetical protein